MNQIKKRLEIIKIAISMTDTETIRLQMLKLEPFEMDDELKEILALLQSKNYAQAQALITTYIAPKQTATQTNEKKEQPLVVEKSIIDEFELLMPETTQQTTQPNLHQPLESHNIPPVFEVADIQHDSHATLSTLAYRNILLKEDLDCDINEDMGTHNYPKIVPKQSEDKESGNLDENNIETTPIETQEIVSINDELPVTTIEMQETKAQEPNTNESNSIDIPDEQTINTEEISQNQPSSNEESLANTETSRNQDKNKRSLPMTNIDTQFDLLLASFPPKHPSETRFQSVKIWLRQISIRGYSSAEIGAMVQHIKELKANQEYAQAAQLTLLGAATGSQLGRLVMARELYRGEILEQNEPEAFSIIEQLALDEYPEAICDLGQFYEYGIGTLRDYKMAKTLYEKAFTLGLQRATRHLEKMTKKSKILPTFKRTS